MNKKRYPKSLKRVGNYQINSYEKFKENQQAGDENHSGRSYLQRRATVPDRRKMEMHAV